MMCFDVVLPFSNSGKSTFVAIMMKNAAEIKHHDTSTPTRSITKQSHMKSKKPWSAQDLARQDENHLASLGKKRGYTSIIAESMLTRSRSFEAKIRHGFDAGSVDNVDVDLGGHTCVRTSYIVSI